MQLFCFTFAGGTATFYDQLEPYLGNVINVKKMEYAGHGNRHKEYFYHDFSELALDMYKYIKNEIHENTSYALMGYSMGSISVTEVLRLIIEKNELPLPVHIFLAAHEPKTKAELLGFNAEEADEYVKARTIQFGGIPKQLVTNRSFWRMYLPMYRNDYGMIGNYAFEDLTLRTMIPTTIFYSETDTSIVDMLGWKKYYTGNVEFVCYTGTHFFIREHCKEMCEVILKQLNVKERRNPPNDI